MAQLISELAERGLFPIKTVDQDGKVMLKLVKTSIEKFDIGFYLHDLHRNRDSDSEVIIVDLDALEIDVAPDYPPVGFIFHLGRSGSTAAVKMLNTLKQYQVIAEAPVLHTLLQSKYSWSEELIFERRKKLMTLFCLLGESKNRRTIFKMASWEVKHKDDYSRLYPEVKSCLIVRNTLEIMVAILQRPPSWLQRSRIRKVIDVEKFSGIDDLHRSISAMCGADIDILKDQPYFRFIGSVMQGILQDVLNAPSSYLVIDHKDIVERVPGDLCAHFNIGPGKDEIQAMRDSTNYRAKSTDKNERYVDDSERKSAEATPELRMLCEKSLQPLLDKAIESNRTFSSS